MKTLAWVVLAVATFYVVFYIFILAALKIVLGG
jgi:hypothetical protein